MTCFKRRDGMGKTLFASLRLLLQLLWVSRRDDFFRIFFVIYVVSVLNLHFSQ